MNAAGLIFDTSWAYLDHLAPLCALLHWPLILCEPDLQEAAEYFYPDLQIIEMPCLGLGEWIEKHFSHLVTCGSKPLLKAALGPHLPTTLWLPHGHSDKGQLSPYFEALKEDEIALIYGQQMQEVLLSNNLSLHMIRIGHFRNLYYQNMRSFYNTLPLNVPFAQNQPILLYAPTWEDAENNCSFWHAFPLLEQHLPKHINLLVKLHPNTTQEHRPALERLIGQTERNNLQFILDFCPILPLLNSCSAYLGDRSSIGYDFLLFDRPMFFLNPHDSPKGRDLLCCGETVKPEHLFDLDWNSHHRFSFERKKRVAYAFDQVPLEQLQSRLTFIDKTNRR